MARVVHRVISAFVLLAAGLIMVAPAVAAGYTRATFGHLPDGKAVESITLSNARGVRATIISYGATLQSLLWPDRNGVAADVTLGYATLDGYLQKPEYFGATVGRCANRLAKGRFTLDGKTYQTPLNDHGNSLHGGALGFDKVLWDIVAVRGGSTASVILRYRSADGEQGYPGTVTVVATYSLDDQGALGIEYRANTDRSTIVNISNHAYWNLAGEGSAGGAIGDVLRIPADTYTPVDETLIPTGEFRTVTGSAFDFRKPTAIGARVRNASDPQIRLGRGYDHNFIITHNVTAQPHLMATVTEPESGRSFELWSNQPGLQFYSGNFLDGTVVGRSGHAYREGDAFVLEPQLFPDTPNHPAFGSARLDPGREYRNVMIYKLHTSPGSKS